MISTQRLACAAVTFLAASSLAFAETTRSTNTTTTRTTVRSPTAPVTSNSTGTSGVTGGTGSGSISATGGYSNDPTAGTSTTYNSNATGVTSPTGNTTTPGGAGAPLQTTTKTTDQRTWSAMEPESTTTTQSAAERTEGQELTGDTESMTGKQMFIAPKLGVSIPFNLDNENSAFMWGGELGFRMGERSTLGVNVLTTDMDNMKITPIMLKLSHYPYVNNGAHFGLQAGLVSQAPTRGDTVKDFGAGLVLGYDYRILPQFSSGIEINHVTVFADDIYHLLNFVVPLKFHF